MGQWPSQLKKEEVVVAAPAEAEASSAAKDESKRVAAVAAPHNFHGIIAQETTGATASELEDQVMHGKVIYLAGKTKKYWVHEKIRCNCFMLFPRALSITWSDEPRYWGWYPLKETSDTEIEVASLQNVCWLEIHGKLELSHLTPDVNYNVVFEVMLTEQTYGWSRPVNLRLKFPDGPVQERKEKMQEKPRNQWLDLKAGEIKAKLEQRGEINMSLFEYGSQWKSGLIVKGVKIVPKEIIYHH